MRRSPPIRAVILAAAGLCAAACGSVDGRPPLPTGRAVVVYAEDREADALEAAARLTGAGFVVATEREGPAVRPRSSVAVYRVARSDADVRTPVAAALAVFPDLEWLPFVHPGAPLTDVVVWFVSHERDAASRAAAPPAGQDLE